ncbi:hypothetical protein BU23DRAFT_529671 [Bimuria novae-zelandiae CBS 107.79]|uniref:Methyltransferase domain-containing protein n=1 Tax=Bimuria novae-zelandiae CBS 107.79 TaxID=1447943 RepID=A0A6A5VE63_9PLEO|nr:hypothetical protein BU23DRAFT_529671 [Bimuria novae-zelandiae CBS 107.79]
MPTETPSITAPWFDTDLDARLTPEALSFFSKYCHLKREDLHEHLHSIHQRAWAIRPYPCVGQWGFLAPKLADSPAYPTVLQHAKAGAVILDFGCCMGQDLRYLAAGGAPTENISHNMFGADIEPAFWKLGYELFQDRGKFKGRFLQSDILDDNGGSAEGVSTGSSLRQQLRGKMDVVYAGAVFHLWDLDTQFEALKGLVELTRRNALFVGCQLGSVEVETKPAWRAGLKPRLFHNAESIKTLWERVSEATGTKWEVEARTVDLDVLLPNERDRSWMDETNRGLFFEATRVDQGAKNNL